MITNRQILGIILQKEEYERRLGNLKSAKAICEWFKDSNAVNSIQEEYNQVMQEYEQWLDLGAFESGCKQAVKELK